MKLKAKLAKTHGARKLSVGKPMESSALGDCSHHILDCRVYKKIVKVLDKAEAGRHTTTKVEAEKLPGKPDTALRVVDVSEKKISSLRVPKYTIPARHPKTKLR